jgi:hypothetical protein
MAGTDVGNLYVKIGTNLAGLTNGLSKALGAVGGFAKTVGAFALGNLLAKGIGGAFSAITGNIGASITNASTLNETLSKTDVLLGNSADQAKKFSAALESKGLGSQAEILESYLASVNQLTNQGVGKQMAQNLAEQLEVRVGDLASQDNADPKMIRENLASAMAGEFQILRKYGVDASAEDQQASGKTRSEYVISKFMAKTKRSEGDFDRTKYGFANLGRASDTKTTAASTRVGQDLLIVGQAFQYFRGRFMDTIMRVAEGGAFKKLGENIYTAFSYIALAADALIGPIVNALTEALTTVSGYAAQVAAFLANPADTWTLITNSIALALLTIWETLTAVANKLSLGLISKQDMGGAKQAIYDDNAAASERIAASKASFDAQVGELKDKFTASTPSLSGAGALGMNAPAATSMKASSSAFNSLLSGVFAQKPDKQLGVLQQIATNTAPKDTGAAPVTNKATLATPKTGGGIL